MRRISPVKLKENLDNESRLNFRHGLYIPDLQQLLDVREQVDLDYELITIDTTAVSGDESVRDDKELRLHYI